MRQWPRVTSTDVARAARVSRATVSYVLNDVPGQRISDETRERVRRIADELGYQPSAAANALRNGTSQIAVIGWSYWPIGPVVGDHLGALVPMLEERGYTAMLHFERSDNAERLMRACARIEPLVLIASANHLTARFARTLRASGTSAILAVGERPSAHAPTLLFPQRAIGEAAIRHLAERGHRRVLAVMPAEPPVPTFRDDRVSGARAQAAPLGVEVEPVHVDGDADTARAIERQLDKPERERPTAIYAYNDEMALRVLEMLLERDISVPGEVAVVGCDDSQIAWFSRPRLSSVRPWQPICWQIAVDAIDTMTRAKRVEPVLHAGPLVVIERETT